MNKEEKEFFYSIGIGSLNLNGKFYYGLDYAITDFMNSLEQENKKYKEVIDKAINFIENGDLLYLATKNSLVYRNNVEVRAVADRLNDLLQILEDKEVSE